MPPKRKTESIPEPSPPAKKRSSKSQPATSEKKRSRDDTVEVGAKSRRKKKVEEVEEEDEENAPTTPTVSTPKEKKTTKTSSTPKAQSAKKSAELMSPPVTALKSASKPRTSRKSVVRIDLPPEPSSGKKSTTASPSATINAPSSNSASTSSAKISSRTRTPLRVPTTPLPTSMVSGYEDGDDEKEIVGLWNQTWGALHMSLSMIGPPFLFIILACYFMGMMQKSQAIASVGVVYVFLFFTIMGSYMLTILPCILVSRMFTCLVSPNATPQSAAELNLYSRLLVLIIAAVGLSYHFLQQQA
mmetsp:Transcript_119335/g.234431  ORF Transcript_119335/g.234431 Transcript_119335/m.234431 type:complete len:301 (+) Transcript_119335:105-1007(+)